MVLVKMRGEGVEARLPHKDWSGAKRDQEPGHWLGIDMDDGEKVTPFLQDKQALNLTLQW